MTHSVSSETQNLNLISQAVIGRPTSIEHPPPANTGSVSESVCTIHSRLSK